MVDKLSNATLAKHFAKLKLTLLKNSFRRSVWYAIALIVGFLYTLSSVVIAIVAAIWGASVNPILTGQWLVLLGAVAILGWWIVPLVAFGVDATVDPHRFTLFPLSIRQLMLGIGTAGAIGVPGVATALTLLGAAFAWWRHPGVLLVAIIGALGAFALCIIGSRALTTWLAPKLEGRRTREIMSLLLVIPLMLLSPIMSVIGNAFGTGTGENQATTIFDNIFRIAGWTPFGAPWQMALSAYQGDWLTVLSRFLILSATVLAAWALWEHALKKVLEHPKEQASSTTAAKGLGLFAHAKTPAGAVAARAGTYWLRDPRYSMSILVVLLLPLIFVAPTLLTPELDYSDAAFMRYFPLVIGPLVGWMLGFSISNDIGFDYTAFALHLSTGVSGRADRLGRIMPVLAVGLPVSLLLAIGSVWYAGRWAWLPAVLGVTIGAILLALGVSAVSSARFVYPVAKPGESPFKQPQGAMGAQMISQLAAMGISMALALPLVALALWAIVSGTLWGGWLTLVAGIAFGAFVLDRGIRMGARAFEQRGPELLAKVHNFL
ncbi:MAG: hypothetical protein LBB58_07095 [Cellulomonadaceae bacterium]|jgi:ABC-2 type transport system permease protein|nr:hypothetical protein [Cellulomonadaceae bacterium]